MDVEAVYKIVSNGGPAVIFLLILFLSLLLSGVLRVKREVEALAEQLAIQKKSNDDLLVRIDRQQSLFERSLDLVERQVMPLVREIPAPRR